MHMICIWFTYDQIYRVHVIQFIIQLGMKFLKRHNSRKPFCLYCQVIASFGIRNKFNLINKQKIIRPTENNATGQGFNTINGK